MENTKATSKKQSRMRNLPKWVPTLAIAIVVIMGIFAISAIVKSVSKNPAEKLFDNYISAVKSQNASKYAGLFYKKGTDEYSELLDNYKEGKDALKSFLNNNRESSSIYRDFWDSSKIDFSDPLEYGLHFWVESQLARGINDYVTEVISSGPYYIELGIIIIPNPNFDGMLLPDRYRKNGIKMPEKVSLVAHKVDGKWVFPNAFSIYKAAAQDEPPTLYAPFDNDGEEIVHVGFSMPVNGIFDLTSGEFEGKNIVSIGDNAFKTRGREVKKVILPDNIKNIGKYAFANCEELTEIVLKDGSSFVDKKITINEGAFYNCRKLKSFQLPKSITSIASYLFYNCMSLTSFEIEPTVTSIGHYAFYGCGALTAVNLPENLIMLGDGAFEKCSKLVTFNNDNNLSNKIIRLGKSVFKDCSALVSVSISEGFTEINSAMFQNCTLLSNVSLPKSLVRIGNNAFSNTAITEINLPKNVEIIGKNAFASCTVLSEFNWNKSTDGKDDTNIRIIGEGAFNGSKALYKFTLPASLKSLGSGAFDACTNLRYVMLDCNYNIDIGAGAFSINDGIPKLYTRYTGEGYLKDDRDGNPINGDLNLFAFTEKTLEWNRLQLEIYSQKIINNNMAILTENGENTLVQYIGNDQNVTLTGINHINRGAFAHNTHIRKLTINSAEIKSIGSDVFNGCSPDFAFDRYKSTDINIVGELLYIGDWLIYGASYKLGEEETPLFAGKVLDLGANTTFRLEGNTTKAPNTYGIAAMAFAVRSSSVSLAEINLPASLKYIGDEAFSGTSITDLSFELNNSKLEYIGDGAFERCELLKSVIFPDTLKTISDNAFYGCKSLRYVKLNSPDTTVGNLAFEYSYNLVKNMDTGFETEVREFYFDTLKIYINGYNTNEFYKKDTNWSIYQNFTYDSSIINGDFAVIEDTIIQYLGTSSSIEVGTDTTPLIKVIGAGAFAGSGISTINIGYNITTIEKNAFYECEKLINVNMLADSQNKHALTYIGNFAFANCKTLTDPTEVDASIDMLDLNAPNDGFTMGKNVFDETLNRRILVKIRADFTSNSYWANYGEAIAANDDPSITLRIGFVDGFAGNDSYQNNHEWVNVKTNEEIKRAPGATLLATALPDEINGYEFVGWYKDSATGVPESISITNSFIFGNAEIDDTYYAIFKRTKIAVSARVETSGSTLSGRIDEILDGTSRPWNNNEVKMYNVGETISLKAVPTVNDNYDYVFMGWFIDDNLIDDTNLEYSYILTSLDFRIEAKFAVGKSRLTIASDSGDTSLDGGSVTATLANNEEFTGGKIAPATQLKLVAQANAGFKFMGWYLNGIPVSDNSTIETFTKGNNAESMVARFRKILTISFEEAVFDGTEYTTTTEGGTYTISYGAGDYIHENPITLTANESETYKFFKWQYKEEGKDTWTDVPASAAIMTNYALPLASAIRVVFMKASVLTIEISDEEGGSVNIESGKQIVGNNITLKAFTNDGYNFDGWYIGDVRVSTSEDYIYKVTEQDVTITAKFVESEN